MRIKLLAIAVSLVSGNILANTAEVAQPGCVRHTASTQQLIPGNCDYSSIPQADAAREYAFVGGNNNRLYVDSFAMPANQVVIGNNNLIGVDDLDGTTFNSPSNNVSVGNSNRVYGGYNTAIGGSTVVGRSNIALYGVVGVLPGMEVPGDMDAPISVRNAVAISGNVLADYGISIGAGGPPLGQGTLGASVGVRPGADYGIAIGSGATVEASAMYGVAIGFKSISSEVNTVSFGNATTRRRLVNIADAVGNYDAVNLGQMRTITDAMTAQITNLDGRITVMEGAAPAPGGGGAVDLTPAYQYTDTSSAQTLSSANAYTDTSSAQTLSSANAYTDASSAQTLSSANAYTDAAVAGVVGEAKAYTDRQIAKSEKFLSAGIAAVAAQPSMPALSVGQKAVAVGTGHFNGANAVGVAFGYAPSQGVVLSGGVSGVSGEGKPVFRTSASYVW